MDIHAIFTVTLQLPIESVPASLRGKPEAGKASDQGRGVGSSRVRVAVRFPLQGIAQLLHLDHVHTSMLHRRGDKRGGFSTSRGNNRADTNFPRSRSRFFSAETAVGFRLDPTRSLPRSFYNHACCVRVYECTGCACDSDFQSPLSNPRGTSRTIFAFEILMYLKSLLKGNFPLLSLSCITSYSTGEILLVRFSLCSLLLVYVVSEDVEILMRRVIIEDIFAGLSKSFFVVV